MSCLQQSDQTFDEGNVFELLQTLFDYIKKTFSNDANGEIDTSDQIALRHFELILKKQSPFMFEQNIH